MKLIVGLGNPGKEYENTRHNIGFSLLDVIAKDKGLSFESEKFNAKYIEINICGERVILIKPLSYMNLSGIVVRKYMDYFKIEKDDLLVIQDDLDMVLGKVKFVYNSSSGGHNGIKNIEEQISTREYVRLKIGISNNKDIDTKDYVLSKFNKNDLDILINTYNKLINVVEDFIKLDKTMLMSKYNNK